LKEEGKLTSEIKRKKKAGKKAHKPERATRITSERRKQSENCQTPPKKQNPK
jgi:hypothetical protein